ncbi:MAG: hypothetical protein QF817_03685, partial [Candidatus Poseidoniaceae archaeon]|nr:hypothetical protein [Candidatus Poseidoniaceae archaeon]
SGLWGGYAYLTAVGSTLYFRANDGTNGYELWKSDGTSNGTMMVKDIYPGGSTFNGLGNYPDLTAVGNTLYFGATDGINGDELWKSDGTSNGTVMVKDINPSGMANSDTGYFRAVGNTLYFDATDGTNGHELWKSDGTPAGTVMVKNINPSGDSDPQRVTEINGMLYFRANDGTNGVELWKSDGTSSGTVMVKDINSGSTDSNPAHLTAVGSSLFFAANDGTNGVELWKATTTSTSSVEVNGNIFWQESSERLNANWNANNMSTSTTYDYDWNVYYFDNDTYTLVEAFNGSFSPTATSHTGGTHHWSINNTNIIRGQTYCVEVTFYLSTTALDNDVSCITIPNGSTGGGDGDVEIGAQLVFDVANSNLELTYDGYNLTTANSYSVNWSLYYHSNGTEIFGNSEGLSPSSPSVTNNFASYPLSNAWISRGLTYCLDINIFDSQWASLSSDTKCATIPNGSNSGGSNETISAQMEFDNQNEKLSFNITADGLTITDSYSVNWSLSYNSNDTEISSDTTPTFSPSTSTHFYELAEFVLSEHITRGLEYCVSVDLINSVGTTLATDSKCVIIPISGGGDGGSNGEPDYWGVDGNSLAQMFPQAALDYVAEDCDGSLTNACANAFGEWCESNSNVPGCEVIESLCEDDEDFIISDHVSNPGLGTNDTLITLQLTQTSEDLAWANLNIVIVGEDGTQYQCTPLGVLTDCLILQFDSDDLRWEEGETIHLQEDAQAICDDSGCNLTLKITDSRDGKTLSLARWTDNQVPASSEDIPEEWLNPLCLAIGADTSGGDGDGDGDVDGAGDGTENETEAESDDWWADIPVAGQVIEKIQTKYGKMISAAIFGLSVIGYGYRVVTIRSEMVMKKRMKKFEKRINAARTSSSLRRVQMDIEKAEEKKLLPTGGFGDLMSMIELRAEDLGLAEFLPDEKLVAGGTGLSDDDFREGMDAMREAQEDMLSVAEQLRQQRSQREKSRVAKKTPVKPNEDLVSMKDMATGGGISLPSYHPKDLNRDGKVDEEDERIWAAMSEEERISRSSSPFASDGMTSQIIAFSKLPSSSKSPCSCGSRKPYRKCHMNKDKCPCGSGKRFVSCCAKKRGFK